MKSSTAKILTVLIAIVLVIFSFIAGSIYWLQRTENSCWKNEATAAIKKYSLLKTRADILKSVDVENDLNSENVNANPLEIIEKDPNGCSLGSNGQTVLRVFFNERDEIAKVQVFRNYIASDYQMTMIKEIRY